MTDSPRPSDDAAALRNTIEALIARLDRIEAQTARPSAVATAQARLSTAWDVLRGSPQQSGLAAGVRTRLTGALQALRGSPQEPGSATPSTQPKGLLWPVLTICAVLVALILAVELAEEIFDGLWQLGSWID